MGRRERRRSVSDSSSSSSSSSSDEDCGRHRSHKRSGSKSKSKHKRSRSKGRRDMGHKDHHLRERDRHGSHYHSDRDDRDSYRDRPRTPVPQVPLYTTEHKGPRIAMILLLGPSEREFRLTEAHILFDSPNDLTSTYYASAESAEAAGPPKTYRLPDRDAAIFEIIFRYLNREQVLPLRRSACPTYLSYEQTLLKMAEEAKFYRFTKLQRALPQPPSVDGGNIATLTAPEYANQSPVQPRPTRTPQSSHTPLLPVAPSPMTHTAPAPKRPLSVRDTTSQRRLDANGTSKYRSHSRAPSTVSSPPPSRAPSRGPTDAESASPPQSLSAYIYRPGQFGVRRGEPLFELVDYPDDVPMPHLFLRVTNAEIKFSAFRNAVNDDVFELRWSLRVLDEPSTRALAYRVQDSTIKAVDSHLRMNGVVGDMVCRDVPLRIRHAKAGHAGRQGSLSDYNFPASDDDGVYTSDLEELLNLITSQGYVKWPRIWQDTLDNVTPLNSFHQRVCLASCEVLLDIEFPEDTAEISAEVGGRGFTLDVEDEEDLFVRNYRAILHGIKCDTRKMRRLTELDNLDPDSRLAKQVSDSLSVEPSNGSSRYSHTRSPSRHREQGRPLAPPRPSYHERHVSRGSYARESPTASPYDRSSPPASYQYSDPGTARTSDSGYLGIPAGRDYHDNTGWPRSTASEEIRRRAMKSWQ